MPIYTKTGDDGTTSLFGGRRVLKTDVLVEAYGTVDELSSFLGLIICKIKSQKEGKSYSLVQTDLHHVMASLAGSPADISLLKERVVVFEKKIDTIQASLPPLSHFILPQGNELSVLFHLARTICRKAERRVVTLKTKGDEKGEIIKYLNRLSDLLFAEARLANKGNEVAVQ